MIPPLGQEPALRNRVHVMKQRKTNNDKLAVKQSKLSEKLLDKLSSQERDELLDWAIEFYAAKDTSQVALRARFPDFDLSKETEPEQWQDIWGYKDLYQVSNLGNITNKKTGKMLSQSVLSAGHRQVGLFNKNGKRKSHYVHRLVAKAWVTPGNSHEVVINHKNGNPADNRASNLEWLRQKENITQPEKEIRRLERLKKIAEPTKTLKSARKKLAENYARFLASDTGAS